MGRFSGLKDTIFDEKELYFAKNGENYVVEFTDSYLCKNYK